MGRPARRSVRSRMIGADGALLSGDADSAAVVALMAEASPRAVRTLGTGPAAEPIARRFATDHVDAPPFEHGPDDAEMLAVLFDEPFADPRAIRDFASADAARDTMAVALLGMGGALAMADGERHRRLVRGERLRALLHIRVRQPLFTRLGAIWPDRDGRTRLEALALEGAEAYAGIWRSRRASGANGCSRRRRVMRWAAIVPSSAMSMPWRRLPPATRSTGHCTPISPSRYPVSGSRGRIAARWRRGWNCACRCSTIVAAMFGPSADRAAAGRRGGARCAGPRARLLSAGRRLAPAGRGRVACARRRSGGGAGRRDAAGGDGLVRSVALTTMVEAHRGGDAIMARPCGRCWGWNRHFAGCFPDGLGLCRLAARIGRRAMAALPLSNSEIR